MTSKYFIRIGWFVLFIVCIILFLHYQQNSHSNSDYPDPSLNKIECDASSFCLLPPLKAILSRLLVSSDNGGWSFSVLADDWENIDSHSEVIKTMLRGKNADNLLFLSQEPTTNTFPQYTVSVLRDLTSDNYDLVETEEVVINKDNWIKATIESRSVIIWSWISIKNGLGYVLSCGGEKILDAGTRLENECQEVAETIKVE